MSIVCVIQARMSSTRLPGKVLLELGDRKIIDHVVGRASKLDKVSQVIVAMSTNSDDDILYEHCLKRNYGCFRGSELNVLSRYYEAVKAIQPEFIIRVTADCPFIDVGLIDQLIQLQISEVNDYSSTSKQENFPLGFSCEIFTFDLLVEAIKKATNNHELEHVTPYFYQNSDRFKIGSLLANDKQWAPGLRLTLDTKEDYELILSIYNVFQYFKKEISLESLVVLYKVAPLMFSLNSKIKQKTIRSSFSELKAESLELLNSYGLDDAVEFMDKNWLKP